jgi:hypothetical protein
MSLSDDKTSVAGVPAIIRDYMELLNLSDTPAPRLRAMRGILQWLREVERIEIERARESGMTWEEIGDAQDRPRQVVHRQASKTPHRPRVNGLTSPEFDGVGTPDLRYWLTWWSAPERSRGGVEEKGRDPKEEQQRLVKELAARERLGVAGPERDRAWPPAD